MGQVSSSLDFRSRQNGIFKLNTIAGVDNIVAARPIGFLSLENMQAFIFESVGANTGAVTLDIGDGIARPLKHIGGAALIGGDIPAADTVVECFYDSSVNEYHAQLIRQPYASIPARATLAGAAGTSTRYARGDHSHPPEIPGTSALIAAGYVGEYYDAKLPAAAPLNLPSGTVTDIAQLNLSAGNWLVGGHGWFNASAVATLAQVNTGINNASATFAGDDSVASLPIFGGATWATTQAARLAVPARVFSSAAPFSVYLSSVAVSLSAGSMVGAGKIWAVRLP